MPARPPAWNIAACVASFHTAACAQRTARVCTKQQFGVKSSQHVLARQDEVIREARQAGAPKNRQIFLSHLVGTPASNYRLLTCGGDPSRHPVCVKPNTQHGTLCYVHSRGVRPGNMQAASRHGAGVGLSASSWPKRAARARCCIYQSGIFSLHFFKLNVAS